MVKIRPSIAKGNKARTTFFSKEAGNMLRTILKKKKDNDFIFGNDNTTVTVVRQYNEQGLINYCKKVGLAQKYENSPRFKITSHSFRAFFITKLSRHDENFAKKLAGQTGYLLQYDRMNDEEKLEKYIEFEHDLTIYDENRTLTELERVKQVKDKLALSVDDNEKKIKNLENEFMRMKFDLAELLRKEGKKSKLNSSLKKYSDLKKHVKYGDDEESIYIKDIDDEEILY